MPGTLLHAAKPASEARLTTCRRSQRFVWIHNGLVARCIEPKLCMCTRALCDNSTSSRMGIAALSLMHNRSSAKSNGLNMQFADACHTCDSLQCLATFTCKSQAQMKTGAIRPGARTTMSAVAYTTIATMHWQLTALNAVTS